LGGYADGTVNNLGGHNVNGAVNIPIIQDKLAIRIAGEYDYNEANRVTSINDPGLKPYQRTDSERATVRFDPTDAIEIIGTVQAFKLSGETFDQVESANIADPSQPAPLVAINSFARKSVENSPNSNTFKYLDYNLRATWHFFGQKLDYVGAYAHEHWFAHGNGDVGDFFNSDYPDSASTINSPFQTGFLTSPSVKNYSQATQNFSKVTTNEVRLASEDPLWGFVDYTVGALFDHEGDPVHLWNDTPIFFGTPTPGTLPGLFEISYINQVAATTEDSAFANVNIHIDEATELSGGVRYIDYKAHAALTLQLGAPLFASPANPSGADGAPAPLGTPSSQKFHPFIYSASLKHTFNDDIMAYISTGTSWRANANTNGIIGGATARDSLPFGLLDALDTLAPEKSTSYEAGIKTEWFDKTVLANLTVYHQKFSNYFYSSPNVIVASQTSPGVFAPGVYNPAISVDVPATVNGAEAEFGYQPLPNWSINAEVSYSLGKIDNGVIPCNTAASTEFQAGLITAAQFLAANGGQQAATCKVNVRAGINAPFSAQVQSEYSHPIFSGRFDGFGRGLLQINGDSQNDPLNPIDNISAYTNVNLYAGVRDPDGMWELTFYGKNVFDTQRVLSRGVNPLTTSIQILATGVAEPTGYRSITVTPQPEFGINLHILLGSG
jgi:iron complex outermembrane receptor protein